MTKKPTNTTDMDGTAMAAYLGKGGEALAKSVELLHEGMDPVMAYW